LQAARFLGPFAGTPSARPKPCGERFSALQEYRYKRVLFEHIKSVLNE